MPDLATCDLTPGVRQWLARSAALVKLAGQLGDSSSFNTASEFLKGSNREANAERITMILYRTLAHAELNAPAGIEGAFIPVGGSFDAFTQVGKVLERASQSILFVDPYADEKLLTQYGVQIKDGVSLKVLADKASVKPTLKPAADAWIAQFGVARPLEVRLSSPKTLHDRLLFIDDKEVWNLSQSLNNFAKRSPASIARMAEEVSKLKKDAYWPLWDAASIVC